MAFTSITSVLGNPSTWPEGADAAVKHYPAAGPQSSVKITLHDKTKILCEFWDRLFADQRTPAPAPVEPAPPAHIEIDKLMPALSSPLPVAMRVVSPDGDSV